ERMRTKLFFAILFFGCVSIFSQWEKQTTFSGAGCTVDAKDSNFAVFASGANVYYTINGGVSWIQKNFTHAICLSAIDESNIWIVTGLGHLCKTDTSLSTVQQFYDLTKINFFNYIEMFDTNNGIAMGDKYSPVKAVFIQTTNGGTNWNVVSGSDLDSMWSGDLWRRIDFVNMNVGYFARSISGKSLKILKSTNGGTSWNETSFNKNAHIIKFYNEDIGFAYVTGKVYRTTTGGTSWDEFSISSATGWGNDIEFLPGDSTKVWLLTEDKVFFSSNFGNSWSQVQVDTEPIVARDIIFVDENNGWLLCDGKIYHTTTGGLSNIKNQTAEIPTVYSLEQNYPNPFNPTTTIKYQLPESGFVSLKIYDMLGREITELVNQFQPAGTYSVNFDANNLASGIYFYRIEANNFVNVKKMVLMK
ncbi:MAG: T9SS type A sorting domain-containing protein, partial [Candidatus Atribacteria bacterium]|nr:T9SS type A sorting domain-containing protein [Candidatus Atribacteria bacterium]